ncbi:BREX-1 system adenine-specific DNA-methyltransferase PglX [Pseudalkalibacillus decolorationis]|uniref:BREX-1 system adenine-specific DNA-methyltransferase PglX n=1 Tax=Pseudalkalibacillus decolorationis TaxID=163879 RepID=UPI002148DF4B|nr:BREX-1 system adenine-specific DNA-methyltransferase PglX [Pseudalkalibacillus decolorationis]
MNKTALKNFAMSARRELLKKIEAKAMKLGITESNIKKAEIESSDAIFIDGRQLSKNEKIQRDKLIDRVGQIGYCSVMDEVAYTWFNRFTALRFMEVNNYLPTKIRVLSSINAESAEPDMMKEALSLDLEIDKELVYELKINNYAEELFKYLIIKHCNDLNRFMPFMFEKIDDYTEILFPEGLLTKESFLREMTYTEKISESDWHQIEIIGWLYQFYIVEEKERVFKQKSKYKAEEIPYATQLFTPNWIVRYMVQNSLGRYWFESHPEHQDLLESWEFYIENNQKQNYEEKLASFINKELKVEDIKCFDPAMGSGHILVYMFDVLYEIYSKCGYMEREIPRLIIENNLYGLDIDDRAYQLACFSVVMKALEYNKRLFRSIEREGLELNFASIQETNILDEEDIAFIAGDIEGKQFESTKGFINQFKDAKSIGSLLKVDKYNHEFLEGRLKYLLENPAENLFEEELRKKVVNIIPKLLKQNEIMLNQFEIVVTNPPYMGNKFMNTKLTKYLNENYPYSKSDLFATFMEVDHYLTDSSISAMINQHSWMFLSTFENMRKTFIDNNSIITMLHLGSRAFEDVGGEIVQTTAFVYRKSVFYTYVGQFIRLIDFKDAKEKEQKVIEAIRSPQVSYRYENDGLEYSLIKGSPLAYWISENVSAAYKTGTLLGDISKPRSGQNTGDNARFIRKWYEVNIDKIGFGLNTEELAETSKKWIPYNKGGEYRKWYGNYDHVINWENNGFEIKDYAVFRNKGKHWSRYIQNIDFLCCEGITWSFISSSNFSMRYLPQGFICDYAGCAVFPSKEKMFHLIGFLNSKPATIFMEAINPTLNFQPGNVASIPIIDIADLVRDQVNHLVTENIMISKEEWNSYETAWGFSKHPLLTEKYNIINDSFLNWNKYIRAMFNRMKANEEEINKIFIRVYGVDSEVDNIIDDSEVSIRIPDDKSEVKSFISYAIGCTFGRYSLDEEGLIYAGGEFDPSKYETYPADKDNILPILSGAYIEDDIVLRFIEFVQVTFGEDTLLENLDFIADTLGKKKGETAKETIRRYFMNDFFKDHVQTYKKRPIYWLFTSGKQKAFNCLIYMHRYDKTTLSRIRTDYLHEYQIRLDAEKRDLFTIIEGDSTAKEISNAKKELKTLEKKIEELKEYDEVLHHMADMQMEIDLDDGVVVNYEKFKGLVAKI